MRLVMIVVIIGLITIEHGTTGDFSLSENSAKNVRKYIFDYFLKNSRAPVLEQVMAKHHLSRPDAFSILKELETKRHLVLLPGTQRIYMVNPFSNLTTPFGVSTGGNEYFAACAVDAIGFHAMLDNQDVTINSYCHHCADPIRIQLKKGRVVSNTPENVLVYVSTPASKWWNNIVDTCSNNMVFHASKEHLGEWQSKNPGMGKAITVSKTLELCPPLFTGRLSLDFVRPSADELGTHFDKIGLLGEFWKLK